MTTCPPLSVDVDILATAVTAAADVANNARHVLAAKVDGGPPPTALSDDTDDGTGNTSVQVAVVSTVSEGEDDNDNDNVELVD